MTTNLTSLTQADIQRWVGSASFQKGMSYFSRGAIYITRLQGQTLKAHCRGSQAASYTLQATLGPAGIASASCSCVFFKRKQAHFNNENAPTFQFDTLKLISKTIPF